MTSEGDSISSDDNIYQNPQESLLNEINPESLLYSSMLKSPWELSDLSIFWAKSSFLMIMF